MIEKTTLLIVCAKDKVFSITIKVADSKPTCVWLAVENVQPVYFDRGVTVVVISGLVAPLGAPSVSLFFGTQNVENPSEKTARVHVRV